MTPDDAFDQQDRYFEVTTGGSFYKLVGCYVKPLHGDEAYNFMIVKGNDYWNKGDKVYLYTPLLRPVNIKDQRKLEQEVINAASKARRQARREEAITT